MLSPVSALYALVIGYLLGSIPFGLLLTRIKGLGDIRHVGSGNIGATNVSRLGGKGLGILTLLLDAGKGALAVFLLKILAPEATAVAAFAAVLGHVFPAWLGFKGGKGIAPLLGAFLVLSPTVAMYAVGVFGCVLLLTRYVSVASIVGVASFPLIAALLQKSDMILLGVIMAGLVVFTHRQNIQRLLMKKEPKLGEKLISSPRPAGKRSAVKKKGKRHVRR